MDKQEMFNLFQEFLKFLEQRNQAAVGQDSGKNKSFNYEDLNDITYGDESSGTQASEISNPSAHLNIPQENNSNNKGSNPVSQSWSKSQFPQSKNCNLQNNQQYGKVSSINNRDLVQSDIDVQEHSTKVISNQEYVVIQIDPEPQEWFSNYEEEISNTQPAEQTPKQVSFFYPVVKRSSQKGIKKIATSVKGLTKVNVKRSKGFKSKEVFRNKQKVQVNFLKGFKIKAAVKYNSEVNVSMCLLFSHIVNGLPPPYIQKSN